MMTDYDDEFDNTETTGSGLRKQLEKAVKEKEALAKRLESLEKSARQGTVEAVVASRKLPPKLTALIPDSLTDKADIEKWLDDYGDVFAPTESKPVVEKKADQEDPAVNTPDFSGLGDNLSAEQMFEMIQQVVSGSQPSTLPDGRDPFDALKEADAKGGVQGIEQFMREQGLLG